MTDVSVTERDREAVHAAYHDLAEYQGDPVGWRPDIIAGLVAQARAEGIREGMLRAMRAVEPVQMNAYGWYDAAGSIHDEIAKLGGPTHG